MGEAPRTPTADAVAWAAAPPFLFSLVDCVVQQLLVLCTHGHLLFFYLIQKIHLPLLPKIPLHQMSAVHPLRSGQQWSP